MNIECRPFKVNFYKEIDGEKVRVPSDFWTAKDECLILDGWDERIAKDPLTEAIAVLETIMGYKVKR